MDSLRPQSYSTCLKRMIPVYFKMNKEAIILMCNIIYEINLNLIKDCLSNKNGAKDVTVKYVESSIRRLIPKELRASALAAGYGEIVRFQSGLIIYKDPKFPRSLNFDPNMLRKGLQQLAETSHRNLTLSKHCSAIGCIIYKLAIQMAEKAISTIGDNSELLLEDLRSTVYNILGDELFNHAEGHAASNLNWYISDTLDFALKPIHSDGTEAKMEEECELLPRYIQKLAKSQYSVSFTKNGAKTVDKILKEIVYRILEDTRNFVVNKVLQNLAVSEYVMYEVVQKLFPPVMFKLACSYAQGRVLNYSCGMLKYEYKRPVEDIEAVLVDAEEVEFTEENVLPDYRKVVKRLMQEYHCTPAKGFLPLMNTILNDVGVAFAEMCSQNARRNDNILSENDVFAAVNTLLPEGLRNHAFARIVHVGRECPSQDKPLMDMLMFAHNHAPYEFDQVYSSAEKPSELTGEISVGSPLEESSTNVTRTDSENLFPREPSLPHNNISSLIKNENSIVYTHDALLSPFSDYSQDKSKITEEKLQEHSYTPIRRPFQGNEQNETSIEQLSDEARESIHGNEFSRLSDTVSDIDAKYSEDQIPKSVISAVHRKQSPSNINEAKLSNIPSLPTRASKNFSEHLQDEKYNSLDSFLPRSESVSTLHEEKSSKSSERDILNNLSDESEVKKVNEDQAHEISNRDGEKEPCAESDEISFLTQASEHSNTIAEQHQNNQALSGNISVLGSEVMFDDNEKQIQSSKQSIRPESNNITQNQLLQDASSSRHEKRSTPINDGNGVSSFFSLLQQASNSILYPFHDRFSTSKENIAEKDKTTSDDVRLRSVSGSKTVLDNNKGNSLSPNEDRLSNLPSENKNGYSDHVHQARYHTSEEQKPTTINEENRLSSIFNLLQQASSTLLYPFQERVDTLPERTPQDNQLLEDINIKSSREQFQKFQSDVLSPEYTGRADTVNAKNKDSTSLENLSGSRKPLKDTRDGHFSSISAYVSETLNRIESEQTENFEGTMTTNDENEQNKLKENLYQETRDKNKTSIDISEEEMKNTNFDTDTIQDDEISVDDISTKPKEKEYEIIFLDIPRPIFWNDIRPYDILM